MLNKFVLEQLIAFFQKNPVAQGKPTTDDEILNIEKALNIKLDDDFKEFTMRFGGCVVRDTQILYNSEDNINFDEALFYDLWSKETLFEDTFSDGPNYQIPLNIINEIIIDFKEPDYFNEKIVKNMFAIGLQDSGFLCFNPEDNSLCVLYPDGFITTIASSFDFFINNIKE